MVPHPNRRWESRGSALNAITFTFFIGKPEECAIQWRGDGSWEGWLGYQKRSTDKAWTRRPDLDKLSTAGVSTAYERMRDHPEAAAR
jgi:hypothetical protein